MLYKYRQSSRHKTKPKLQETRVKIYIDLKNFDGRVKDNFFFKGSDLNKLEQFAEDNKFSAAQASLNRKLFSNYFQLLGQKIVSELSNLNLDRAISLQGLYLYSKIPHLELDTANDDENVTAFGKMAKSSGMIDFTRHKELSKGQGIYVYTGYQNYIVPDFLKSGKAKKGDIGVDASIATDMVRDASKNQVDVLILITEDNDFNPIARHISGSLGKHVYLCGFDNPNRKRPNNNIKRLQGNFENFINIYDFTLKFIEDNWTAKITT